MTKKVAVIGSGFGGLAVAIRLQCSGYQVKIFEKRDLPGGRAYVYREKGFVFDAGPTVITAPECLDELFVIAKKIEKIILNFFLWSHFIVFYGTMVTLLTIVTTKKLSMTKFKKSLLLTFRDIKIFLITQKKFLMKAIPNLQPNPF